MFRYSPFFKGIDYQKCYDYWEEQNDWMQEYKGKLLDTLYACDTYRMQDSLFLAITFIAAVPLVLILHYVLHMELHQIILISSTILLVTNGVRLIISSIKTHKCNELLLRYDRAKSLYICHGITEFDIPLEDDNIYHNLLSTIRS